MIKTISKSPCGLKKEIVVVDKGESRTYHLVKRDGKWFGIQGHKFRNIIDPETGIIIDTQRIPIYREF